MHETITYLNMHVSRTKSVLQVQGIKSEASFTIARSLIDASLQQAPLDVDRALYNSPHNVFLALGTP